ncbi:phage GP46 family protein [Chromobacterium sp. IIBBL 290-4]|uniref:phage GP46 family protein n=1 Tax=Chromobacterium sp. IIBBL 290-4 TaxID=2953890 RepID=UPI0020B8F05D|nr:phage GP46 family protein [Chromobacterium sp. IIBBL 290-4]UTH76017.1 phage GP46 family protein [Chromobacterium sp. IIBBL 290-4]
MDPLLDPLTGDYAGGSTDTLANAVYLRLMTPLGGWWADPTLGSRLHELSRSKDSSRIDLLACQYAEQALQPLQQDGRASRIQVSSQRPGSGRLLLDIEVADAGGRTRHFQHQVRIA